MLIIERLYSLDFRSLEVEKRELLLDVFADELRQLHRTGFVHRYIQRPSEQPDERYDNVFLTNSGLWLIYVGISAMKTQVGDKIFNKYAEIEERELTGFGDYFLSR